MPRRAVDLQRGAKTGSGDSDFRYPRHVTRRTSPATQTLPQRQVRLTSRPRFCCSPPFVRYRRTPNTRYRTLGAADMAAARRTTFAAKHQAVTRRRAADTPNRRNKHTNLSPTSGTPYDWASVGSYSPFFPETCRFAATCCRRSSENTLAAGARVLPALCLLLKGHRPPTRSQDRHMLLPSQDRKCGYGAEPRRKVPLTHRCARDNRRGNL